MKKFNSVNETDKFIYKDCVIVSREKSESGIVLTVEALIVKPDNSQNSNYTKSYAGTAEIVFENGAEISGVKDGYRKYDANDKIVEEVDDTVLDDLTLESILKSMKDMYLEGIEKIEGKDNEYVIFIEKPSEYEYDTSPCDSYQIKITCDKITVSWDKYLNRVED